MNFTAIEADVSAMLARFKHAVFAVLGMAEDAVQDVQTLEAESPLVKDAIVAGEAFATSKGIPVTQIVAGAEAVLAMAKQIDAATPAAAKPAAP